MTANATGLPISTRQRVFASLCRNRRRLATGSAMLFAALLGYYAVAGDNGLTVYKQKRADDRLLAGQIEELKQENDHLQEHIERLRTDPDAIEHEAREKLRYARPGEVIYTLRDPPVARTPPHPPAASSTAARSPAR